MWEITLFSSSLTLQFVLRGRVIIITPSLNTEKTTFAFTQSSTSSHSDRLKKSMYREMAVLGNLSMRLYPPTDMDGGPAKNILLRSVFLINPFALP